MTTELTAPSAARIDTASAIFGDAFADYPMFRATLRDDLRRRASLPLMWRAVIRQAVAVENGEVDLVERDGRTVGAALWTSGNGGGVTWLDVVRHGQLRFGLAAGVRDSLRLMKLQDRVDAFHKAVITEPHVYLLAIGALASTQGQGVGTELLERGLARVDQRQLPVYLETYLERNVKLYHRHGFVTVRTDDVDGLTCHSLLRPAQ